MEVPEHFSSGRIDHRRRTGVCYILVKAVYERGATGYRRLKARLESKDYLNYVLSSYTYDLLIKKLREWDILTRPIPEKRVRSDGKAGGPSVLIDLTDNARKKYRLGTLVMPESVEETRTQLLQVILYFAAKTNQRQFEFHPADKQVLNQYLTSLLLNCCSIDKLTTVGPIARKMDHTTSILYDSPSPCLLIWKDEITALDNHRKRAIIHYVKILGVSVDEVLYREDRPFWLKSVSFTSKEVQKMFDTLVELKVMKEIGTLWLEPRYDFVDEWLSDIVTLFCGDHELLLSQMGGRLHSRKLAAMRRKWLVKYLGDNEADAMIRSNYDTKDDAEDWADLIARGYDKIKQIHKKKVDEYELVVEFLSQMVYVFQKRTARNKNRMKRNNS